jgi:hypothetical protein
MMSESVQERYQSVQQLADEILSQMSREVSTLGFEGDEVKLRTADEAAYGLEQDPSNAQFSLVGYWMDSQCNRQGCLLFHPDGSFYVEQDIVRPHPNKKQWFVEAINAWGKGGNIKVEAKLLPMPE